MTTRHTPLDKLPRRDGILGSEQYPLSQGDTTAYKGDIDGLSDYTVSQQKRGARVARTSDLDLTVSHHLAFAAIPWESDSNASYGCFDYGGWWNIGTPNSIIPPSGDADFGLLYGVFNLIIEFSPPSLNYAAGDWLQVRCQRLGSNQNWHYASTYGAEKYAGAAGAVNTYHVNAMLWAAWAAADTFTLQLYQAISGAAGDVVLKAGSTFTLLAQYAYWSTAP